MKEKKHRELEEKLESLKSQREKLEMQIQSDNIGKNVTDRLN